MSGRQSLKGDLAWGTSAVRHSCGCPYGDAIGGSDLAFRAFWSLKYLHNTVGVGNTPPAVREAVNTQPLALDHMCRGSSLGAEGVPETAMEFVRGGRAGHHLGKTRTPALMGWKSVAAGAPICGETPGAEIAIPALFRPIFIM